jgi:hypothetical protein
MARKEAASYSLPIFRDVGDPMERRYISAVSLRNCCRPSILDCRAIGKTSGANVRYFLQFGDPRGLVLFKLSNQVALALGIHQPSIGL